MMAKLRLTHSLPVSFSKIAAIKAVRNLTNIGLKEAKDAVEAAMTGEIIELSINIQDDQPLSKKEAYRDLVSQGMEFGSVAPKVEFIIAAVKESAKLAVDEDEEMLAILLLDVIRQHKENNEIKEQKSELERETIRNRSHTERIRKDEIAELGDRQEKRWYDERVRRDKKDNRI